MNTRTAAAGLVALALLAGGFAYYLTHVQPRVVNQTAPRPVAPLGPKQENAAAPQVAPPPREATIYTVKSSGGDSNDLGPEKVPVALPASPARSALQSLIDAPQTPLPVGTHLLGITIAAGLATVNFSSQFQKNFHGGDEQEAQAVNSILLTLGQFDTIDRVQILVDGATIDTLGGHFEIGTPLDVVRSSTRQASSVVTAFP